MSLPNCCKVTRNRFTLANCRTPAADLPLPLLGAGVAAELAGLAPSADSGRKGTPCDAPDGIADGVVDVAWAVVGDEHARGRSDQIGIR